MTNQLALNASSNSSSLYAGTTNSTISYGSLKTNSTTPPANEDVSVPRESWSHKAPSIGDKAEEVCKCRLSVKVCDVETKIITGKKHTVYNLVARYDGNDFRSEKRYRDFTSFRKLLVEKRKELNVHLPAKRQLDFLNPSILAKRLYCIENFLKALTSQPNLCELDETLSFFAIKLNGRRSNQHASSHELITGSSENVDPEGSNTNTINLGTSQNYQVKPSDFDFLKHIGRGSYGKVYLTKHKAEGKIYAIKVLDKSHVKRKNEIKHVMAERNVMVRVIDHPFLVKMHYSFQTPDKLYFVVDFINGGELFYHLQQEQVFSETRARFYSAEIISAVGCLHQNGVIYRDLKPENILLDNEGHVKLTDFGLCKEGMDSYTVRTNTFCGTPEYLAPEIIRKRPYTRAVDWWCTGAVLYEMLIGMPPFYNKNYRIMHHDILHKPIDLRAHISEFAKDILLQLLEKEPEARLGSSERDVKDIQAHPFFKPINWTMLYEKKIQPPLIYKTANKTDLRFIDPEFIKEPVPASVVRPNMTQGSTADDCFLGFTYVDPPHLRENNID